MRSVYQSPDVDHETLSKEIKAMVKRLAPPRFIDDKTIFYINPTGRFVVGGPNGDCGLTGRKIIVDTYGGMDRHEIDFTWENTDKVGALLDAIKKHA